MATSTNTLALKIGQVKDVPVSTPRLGSHIFPNLLDDSPMETIKNREQRIPFHSILETVKRKTQISSHQCFQRTDPQLIDTKPQNH